MTRREWATVLDVFAAVCFVAAVVIEARGRRQVR